jgi:hypothetical protein
MKSILDPSFRYTSSVNTDLQKTFARIRLDYRQEAETAVQATAGVLANVSSIVRKTTTGPATSCVLAGGVRMRRRAGVSTGAMHGRSVEADGTTGIAALHPRRPPCLSLPQEQDQRGSRPPSSLQQGAAPAPRGQPPQKGGGDVQRHGAAQVLPQQGGPTAQPERPQPQQGAAQRQQQTPRSQGQDKGPQGKGPSQESKRGQEKGRDKGEQQGGERNK